MPLVTYGKSQHQAEAVIGDAVADVVAYARQVSKPVVIKQLDFRQKKAALEGESRRYSRMLSSFSYGKIKTCFVSRGYRKEVDVHQVNPAFSSVIGRVKFMERYGSAPTRQPPWCCPVPPLADSAVPSASHAGGWPPSAMASRSPSPCLQGSE